MRQQLFTEIEAERRYQEEKWGNAFDDTHTPADWWTFVSLYYTRALPGWKNPGTDIDRKVLRRGLVKMATILVAWIEAVDRKVGS